MATSRYQRLIPSLTRPIPERIRAQVELTESACRRYDEIQSYLELRNEYTDEEILLCLEILGDSIDYPLSYLRARIRSLLPSELVVASSEALPAELWARRADAFLEPVRRRFEALHPIAAVRERLLAPLRPPFPLPEAWASRLALITWGERMLDLPAVSDSPYSRYRERRR